MAIPREARIHLVYQFIILTVLVIAIGYNEILPDKKYLFLALIPVFCYQLLIVFCCSEILPIPSWLYHEAPSKSVNNQIVQNTDITFPSETISTELPKTSPKSSELVFPRQRLSYKYKLKSNKTEDHKNVTNLKKLNVEVEEKEKAISNFKIETTNACFSNREDRQEEFQEKKESDRPFKVRNWKSVYGCTPPNQSCYNNPILKDKEITNIIPNQLKPPSNDDILDEEASDLTKSYSFPFRQKKVEKWIEQNEKFENEFKIPLMPPWKELNYGNTYGRGITKVRKSISTETLDKELKLIQSRCQEDKECDFTRSVELPAPVKLVDIPEKRNNLKHVTSFNKLKQGIVNCFNKNKRESFKSEETKPSTENKKQFFKELFLSRESLISESEKKEESAPAKFRNLKRAKSENRERYSPSYISFVSDSFGKLSSGTYSKDFEKV